jgi:putative PIN family toxin of toxin-antitoxin system
VLRVVVDPNVLESAAIAGGNPFRVVELASGGLIGVVASPRLLDELRGVLARDKFLRWRTREELDRFVTDIEGLVEPAADPVDVSVVSRDPNDDYLVALVAETGADVLCSGDRDLRDVPGVVVRTPAELVRAVLAQQ